MNEKSQLYDWNILEQYVKDRVQGRIIEQYERDILADDFLQSVVAGMEQNISKEILAQKKRKIWKQLEAVAPALLVSESIQVVQQQSNPIIRFAQNVVIGWRELRSSQFQYILGFNFSCVVLILGLSLWANNYTFQGEEAPLLSQIEFPEGFKP